MPRYAVANLDEIDELADGAFLYRPVRHHFGITAFGATAWTAGAAGDPIINERDPDDPSRDQELFLVVRGHAMFEVAGDRVDAPVGTFVFAPPGTDRTAVAEEDGTIVLALEGTPGKPYDPRGWELWAPLVPLYEGHEYAAVAERLRALVATSPQYGMLFYNLACCESQAGCTGEALAHLRHAVGMGGEWRESAREDSDFDPIRHEPEFQQLIGG